ncbi:MAG: hypothetical protein HY360_04565 [Verrucomicrobia bacterium]|nr:hypothetical protein [Verrucomicrobiota bacterium]
MRDSILDRFPKQCPSPESTPTNTAVAEEWAALQRPSPPLGEAVRFFKGFAKGFECWTKIPKLKPEDVQKEHNKQRAHRELEEKGGVISPLLPDLGPGETEQKLPLALFLRHEDEIWQKPSLRAAVEWLRTKYEKNIGNLKRYEKIWGGQLGVRLAKRGRPRGT